MLIFVWKTTERIYIQMITVATSRMRESQKLSCLTNYETKLLKCL